MGPVRLYQERGVMKNNLEKLTHLSAVITAVVMTLSPLFSVYAEAPNVPIAPTKPVYNEVIPNSPAAPASPLSPAGTPVVEETTTPVVLPGESVPTGSLGTDIAVIDLAAPKTSEDAVIPLAGNMASLGAEVSNSNTGSGSENSAGVGPLASPLFGIGNSDTTINNNNTAVVDNIFDLIAMSGGNQSSYNTGDGSVTSGDSNVMLSLFNLINTVFIAPNGGNIGIVMGNILGDLIGDYLVGPAGEYYSLSGSRLDVGNSDTGANSTNTALVNAGSNTTVNNVNDGTLANNIDVNANTGGNQASYNTGNGSVSSGDANVSLNLLNFLNSSFYASDFGLFGILNVFGDFIGNLIIPDSLSRSAGAGGSFDLQVGNDTTGADSVNTASVDATSNLDINNDNSADILNNIIVSGQSGNNNSGYNTGDGSVASGNVNTDLNVGNNANQNIVGDTVFYAVINVLGEWTGYNALASLFRTLVLPNADGNGQTIIVTNANTGAGSVNEAEVNLDQSTTINNDNTAAIANNVNIDTNTGSNSASYNTGDGSVKSGNVDILANIFNLANLNVVANRFAFFVVNIFGDWKGNVDNKASTTADKGTGNIQAAGMGSSTDLSTSSRSNIRQTDRRYLYTSNNELITPETPDAIVLAANSQNPFYVEETEPEGINPLLAFLDDNLWNILILIGISMITLAAYLFESQRLKNLNNF